MTQLTEPKEGEILFPPQSPDKNQDLRQSSSHSILSARKTLDDDVVSGDAERPFVEKIRSERPGGDQSSVRLPRRLKSALKKNEMNGVEGSILPELNDVFGKYGWTQDWLAQFCDDLERPDRNASPGPENSMSPPPPALISEELMVEDEEEDVTSSSAKNLAPSGNRDSLVLSESHTSQGISGTVARSPFSLRMDALIKKGNLYFLRQANLKRQQKLCNFRRGGNSNLNVDGFFRDISVDAANNPLEERKNRRRHHSGDRRINDAFIKYQGERERGREGPLSSASHQADDGGNQLLKLEEINAGRLKILKDDGESALALMLMLLWSNMATLKGLHCRIRNISEPKHLRFTEAEENLRQLDPKVWRFYYNRLVAQGPADKQRSFDLVIQLIANASPSVTFPNLQHLSLGLRDPLSLSFIASSSYSKCVNAADNISSSADCPMFPSLRKLEVDILRSPSNPLLRQPPKEEAIKSAKGGSSDGVNSEECKSSTGDHEVSLARASREQSIQQRMYLTNCIRQFFSIPNFPQLEVLRLICPSGISLPLGSLSLVSELLLLMISEIDALSQLDIVVQSSSKSSFPVEPQHLLGREIESSDDWYRRRRALKELYLNFIFVDSQSCDVLSAAKTIEQINKLLCCSLELTFRGSLFLLPDTDPSALCEIRAIQNVLRGSSSQFHDVRMRQIEGLRIRLDFSQFSRKRQHWKSHGDAFNWQAVHCEANYYLIEQQQGAAASGCTSRDPSDDGYCLISDLTALHFPVTDPLAWAILGLFKSDICASDGIFKSMEIYFEEEEILMTDDRVLLQTRRAPPCQIDAARSACMMLIEGLLGLPLNEISLVDADDECGNHPQLAAPPVFSDYYCSGQWKFHWHTGK